MRGGGSRTLSPAQLDEMCRLRERGRNPDQIAALFAERDGVHVTPSAIAWQCLTHGADAPPRLRGKQAGSVGPYWRNGRLVRPFTEEEDQKITEWSTADPPIGPAEIGRRLGRKSHSIIGRRLIMARQAARREDAGQ